MTQKIEATHGVACSLGNDYFGYFGWPSVARTHDGTLVAVASGLRNAHVCPFGRTVILTSRDDGETWSSPRVVNDTPFDDRDAGVLALDADELLVAWFTSDNRESIAERIRDPEDKEADHRWESGLRWMQDDSVRRYCGAWVRQSRDGGESWGPPIRVLVNTPHGPIRRQDGSLLYFGKEFGMDPKDRRRGVGRIMAMESRNGGKDWTELGSVPLHEKTVEQQYHEPHVVELDDGTLIGHIRVQNRDDYDLTSIGLIPFSIMQTESKDGGATWTRAHPLGFHGSPPHLLKHSSGALICTYSYRKEPYGERAAISRDGGTTWESDIIIRDDGPDSDLGYPASVELGDGSVFTLYYQKERAGDKCGLLWSRWNLPE